MRPAGGTPRGHGHGAFFSGSGAEKIVNYRGNPLNLGLGQLGINGQAEAFAGGFFGDGEIAGLVAEAGITLLEVQRQGVMEGAANAGLFQQRFQGGAAGMADDIQTPGTFGIRFLAG